MDEADSIRESLIGLKLVVAETVSDELHLTFEDNLTLILSGGYCKEVYSSIKKRVITYEDVD
ncbi:MAG: hypothetical protein ACYCVD_04100 [Desulfitobacteriaceae bacterium]